jgi:DNA-binding NarL/FixJ family response regulator
MILDDHTILRQGVAKLLGAEPDMQVTAATSSVGEALTAVAAGLVDVVLLDLDLGAERGTEFLVQARRNGFQGPVLVLAAAVPPDEQAILDANDVALILTKDSSIGRLADAIRSVTGGTKGRAAAQGGPPSAPSVPSKALREREARVLRLVVEGLSNKAIAAEIGANEPVVKAILQQLFRKTGTNTRAQLVRVALEHLQGEW